MKKRPIQRFLSAACVTVLASALVLSGCGKSSDTAKSTTGDESESSGTIRLINGKAEVAEQMDALAAAYSSKGSVKVEVETIPAGVDVQSTIKGYYLADNMPDIIMCEASGFEKWQGLLVDMSDQAWASDTDAAYVDEEEGTIGFPYTTEAIGLAYNADILKKAGVDPKKLTTPAAYRDAFAAIDAKKGALGLTAVVGWCTEPENLYWSAGNHIFGAYLDSGLDRDDTKYIDMMNNDHKLDAKRAGDYAQFIGMLNQYSDPALVNTGTYDDQVKNFASGKYAFVTQGSWIGSLLTGANAGDYKKAGNFEVGMAPYAFEDGQDTILTSPPSWWAVPKEGNVAAAEEFLQWCAGDEGQKILVEDAGFVSPFTSCKYVAADPFAPVLSEYIAAGKTSNWHWQQMKEGIAKEFGQDFNNYSSGKLDAGGFVNALSSTIKSYYAQ